MHWQAESEPRPSSLAKSLIIQQTSQMMDLRKKEEINPFKFSPDVDFCALSQLDKREKAQVDHFIHRETWKYVFN